MEEDSDDKNTNINRQQDNKGEETKGRWVFCFSVFVLFGFCFVVGLSFMFLSSLKSFFVTKNLVITYKLSTIQSFYYKV